MYKYKISVFTPAFNRGYIIESLYMSLLKQTFQDFEWIVINDGSTDDTDIIMNRILKAKNPFPIVYIKKNNGGKHRAINDGAKVARGKLFFTVDSDDYLTEDALFKINEWENTIREHNYFAGVAGLRSDFDGNLIGQYPLEEKYNKYIDSSNLDRKKNCLKGDKAEAYYTDLLLKYPFPEYKNENFLTEAIVWNKIASDGYNIRWFNEVIYKCEYLVDGLTHNLGSFLKTSPNGWRHYYNQQSKIDKHFIHRAYYATKYINYSLVLRKNIFSNSENKALTIICFPLGVYYYLKRKMKKN